MKSSFSVFTASCKTLYGYLEVVLCLRKKKSKAVLNLTLQPCKVRCQCFHLTEKTASSSFQWCHAIISWVIRCCSLNSLLVQDRLLNPNCCRSKISFTGGEIYLWRKRRHFLNLASVGIYGAVWCIRGGPLGEGVTVCFYFCMKSGSAESMMMHEYQCVSAFSLSFPQLGERQRMAVTEGMQTALLITC